MHRLDGKVALIAGASGALGSCVTQGFVQAGASVVGVGRSIQPSSDDRLVAIPADLSSSESVRSVLEKIAARFGRVDVLVHVIGGFAGGDPVAQTSDSTLARMLDLNLWPAFRMLRAVLPLMRRQGSGRIVVVGSRAAEEPKPLIGAYSASKAALLSLVRTVAMEEQDFGITANLVLPGTMDTPANRAGDPQADTSRWVGTEQVANAILWLASEAASQVTGAAVPVYGRSLYER